MNEKIDEIIAAAQMAGRLMGEGTVRGFSQSRGRPAVRMSKERFEELFPTAEPKKRWKTYGTEIKGVWLYYDG